MSELIGTSAIVPGEIVAIRNKSKGSATYRAEFEGVGYVEFDLLPGAQFRVLAAANVTVNVSIEAYMPPGIQPIGDANG